MQSLRAPLFLMLLLVGFCAAAQVVKESDVPSNVRATAVAQNKNDQVSSWVLDKNRGRYVVTTLSTTALRLIEVSLDGKWLQTTDAVLPQNLPSIVLKAARQACPDFELDNFFYVTAPDDAPYYTIDASSDDEDLTLTVDSSGKLLEKETR
ncbi:MAG TPA: hypothetical protein VK658_09825 [Chryseolinea sp.]|nr:hypothetical protein [Chryseolinea sp.]